MHKRSVFIDECYDGNDDHIDALKEMVRELRDTYARLHDYVSEMVEDPGHLRVRRTEDHTALVNLLIECNAVYEAAREPTEEQITYWEQHDA